MQLKRLTTNLTLTLASTLACLLAIETFFFLLAKTQKTHPAIIYKTNTPSTKLWCYDNQFNSIADWDLRHDHPFTNLTYLGNIDKNPNFANLPLTAVPHAIEDKRNDSGYRERPFTDLKELGTKAKVTLVIGDSFGFGQGVRRQDRFSNILENTLNAHQDSTEAQHIFVNACLPGAGISTISKRLTTYMEYFDHVDRVIYAYTLNDPWRTLKIEKKHKAIYDFMHLRESQLLQTLPAGVRGLPSYTLLWFAQRTARNRLAHDTIEWYKLVYTENSGWVRTKKKIAAMHAFCRERGSTMTLVVFPLFHSLKNYPFVDIHDKLALVAQRHNIDYIDLLSIFAGKEEQDYWVHPKDFHPNHRAHREVADFLLTAISW